MQSLINILRQLGLNYNKALVAAKALLLLAELPITFPK